MVANAGTVKAKLILDSSEFSSQWKKILSGFNTNVNPKGFTQIQQSIRSSTNELENFLRILNTAESHANALGNTFSRAASNIKAAFSRITPGDAMGQGIAALSRQMGGLNQTAASVARNIRQEWASLASAARSAGQSAKNAFPLEYIYQQEKAMAQLRRQVVEAAGSFAASGRSFTPLAGTMVTGWGRVSNAASTAGSKIKGIGSSLSSAANEMNMFSASITAMLGTLGTTQLYNATVGKANAYTGMIQYWNTVYGSGASQTYQNAINSMYTQHYQAKSTSARTLQLLANTLPQGTNASDISSLLPVVAAYRNFYKAMKPDQAALADIEAPQDIAAVFSGNTGEIRASPLASQLKTIASLPQDQKMAALQQLFQQNGVMNYLDGITAYDRNMNKLNSTLDNLSITVGEKLVPAATKVLSGINDFLNGLGGNAQYLVYAAGALAGLAAFGGVFSLAIQGLEGIYKMLKPFGSALKKLGEITGVTDKLKSLGSGIKDKISSALSGIKDKVGSALSPVKEKIGSALSGVKDKIGSALSGAKDKVEEALSPVKDKIKDVLSGAKDKAGDAISGVKDKIVEKLGTIKDAVSTPMTNVKDAITGKLNELKDWIQKKWSPTPTTTTPNGSSKSGSGVLPVIGKTIAGATASYGIGGVLSEQVIGPLFQKLNPDTFRSYGNVLTDMFGLTNSNIPSKNYNEVIKGNKNNSAEMAKNGWFNQAIGNTGSWLSGAAGNTGGFFSWLGKTGHDLTFGSNPLGSLFSPAAGAGGSGKQSITSDIFGKNGLLDFSRFKIKMPNLGDIFKGIKLPDFGNIFKGIKLPNLGNIFKGIKLPTLSLPKIKLPNLGNIFKGIKLPTLTLPKIKIPSMSSLTQTVKSAWGTAKSYVTRNPIVAKAKTMVGNLLSDPRSAWGQAKSYVSNNPVIGRARTFVSNLFSDPTSLWNRAKSFVLNNPIVGRAWAAASALWSNVYSAWSQASSWVASHPIVQRVVTAITGGGPGRAAGPGLGRNILSRAAGPLDMLKGAMSGISYDHYYGHGKSIAEVIASGSANCVDSTLTGAYLSSMLGIPFKSMAGMWDGGLHVWGNYGGTQLDFARKSIDNTYTPPAAGPGTSGNKVIIEKGAIQINGPVYGVDDLDAKIQDGLVKGLNKYLG